MSVMHARVDERLIHGQVAAMWTGYLGITRIIVVNDKVVKDEMMIAALKIARPAGIKLSILSKNKAVEKLTTDFYGKETLFVITQNIADMKYLIEHGLTFDSVNVGNVAKREGTKELKKSVYVTEEEIRDIKELLSRGIRITAQMIPSEPDKSIVDFLPNK